jgi:hypothetical protein
MAKDLASVVQKWTGSAGTAQAAYVTGVETTTKDPVAAAVRAQPQLVQNFTQAVTSGRWARNLTAVGKSGWQAASVAKAGNYSTGIQAGAPKYEAAMTTWLPIINQAAATVNQMPSGSLANNLARSNAFATALYNRKRGL